MERRVPVDVWQHILEQTDSKYLLSLLLKMMSLSHSLSLIAMQWVKEIQCEILGGNYHGKFHYFYNAYRRVVGLDGSTKMSVVMSSIARNEEKQTLENQSIYLSFLHYAWLLHFTGLIHLRNEKLDMLDDYVLWKHRTLTGLIYYDPVKKESTTISRIRKRPGFGIVTQEAWDDYDSKEQVTESVKISIEKGELSPRMCSTNYLSQLVITNEKGVQCSIWSHDATDFRKNCYFTYRAQTLDFSTTAFLLGRCKIHNSEKIESIFDKFTLHAPFL